MKKLLIKITALFLCFCGLPLYGCTNDDVLVVGTSPDFAPFEFIDDAGNVAGFDIDLINAVGEKLNKKVSIRQLEFEGILSAIPNTIDIGISAFTITPQRSESVLFSTPYFINEQVLVVRANETVFEGKSKEQLDEYLANDAVKVGACDGYVGYDYIMELKNAPINNPMSGGVYAYDNLAFAVVALKAGSVDAIIMDKTPAMVAASNEQGIKVIDVTLTSESYGIAMQKGNTELKQKIDEAIEALAQEGTLQQLMQKWFIE